MTSSPACHGGQNGRQDGLRGTCGDGDLGVWVVVCAVQGRQFWRPRLRATAACRGMGGYWLCPACMAAVTASSNLGVAAEVGKALARINGLVLVGQGRHHRKNGGAHVGQLARESRGHRCCHGKKMGCSCGTPVLSRKSKFVIVHVAAHGAQDQVSREAVAERFGKFVHKVAQVGAALEGYARHALAKQVAHGA